RSFDKRKPALTVLYDFCSATNCGDGAYPAAAPTYSGKEQGLAYDGSSPLFGTTGGGGAGGMGVAFEIIASKSGHHGYFPIYSFCSLANCADGSDAGELIVDGSGNLYGEAQAGGTSNGGAVF